MSRSEEKVESSEMSNNKEANCRRNKLYQTQTEIRENSYIPRKKMH